MQEEAEGLSYRTALAEALSELVSLWWSPSVRRVLVDAAGEELGVTEARIVWELGRRRHLRPGELATLLDIGAPSVSKATVKLRQRGLVIAGTDAADSRMRPIRLSPAGIAAARRLYDIGDTLVSRVVSGWDEREVATFAAHVMRFLREATPLTKQEAWDIDGQDESAGVPPADPATDDGSNKPEFRG
ncbi:hypothetical protein NS220_08790 [Microbacterium testaceum]|uniref:HTH marR-type domain-containing protein n=1 Tax=Microbacterium testaceum TaxID=2033 RepID=A0A147EXC1_MICTE|nr:MarR family transcriptional regulator [Microbacterium testaceum]KTR94579.1 hypothetical protein NS220_08790 [Microbacterium testaceum]